MARIAGRNGSLYVAVASGGTAEPIAYLNKFNISFDTDDIDVTAFGDVTKVSVAGLPSGEGSYAGFYDTASAQLYTAATDGIGRKFYLYPDRANNATTYFFGTAIFDFALDQDVSGAVNISGNFQAATILAKVG